MPKGKAPGSPSKSNQMFNCKKVGCRMSFKHKTQLYRHKKKCSAKSPVKANQLYVKENNFYQCKKCKKCYNHQSGVNRHLRTGCQQRKKQFFMCNFCQKSFQFKSTLLRHEKIHEKDVIVPSFVVSDTSIINEHEHSNLTNDSIHETNQHISPDGILENFPAVSIEILPENVPLPNNSVHVEVISNEHNEQNEEIHLSTELHNLNLNSNQNLVTRTKRWREILAFTDATDSKQADVYHCLILYLKPIQHKRQKFMTAP